MVTTTQPKTVRNTRASNRSRQTKFFGSPLRHAIHQLNEDLLSVSPGEFLTHIQSTSSNLIPVSPGVLSASPPKSPKKSRKKKT